MLEITTITAHPKQRMSLVLENNETVEFFLYYLPRQQAWYFDFTYKDLTVNCSKVVLSLKALRQFRKVIPFGIAFDTDGFVEPFDIDDFASGRVRMYILNSSEVKQVETEVFNG